jgi:hypothetical protein
MTQLRRHEIDGDRQLRRGEQLFAHDRQQFLRGRTLGHPLGQCPKEVRLFDVLFAFEGHGACMLGQAGRIGAGRGGNAAAIVP